MGVSSSQLQPQELITFKKLPTDVSLGNIEIPDRPENRTPTNVKWLIILAVFVTVLLPFLIYTLCYADVRRLLMGYDKCGNVCGQKNYEWDSIPCSGKNWTLYPYLQYDEDYHGGEQFDSALLQDRHCVQSCSKGYEALFGRCLKLQKDDYGLDTYSAGRGVKKTRFDQADIDIGLYLDNVKWQIIISCLVSILIAMGMLFLFRYAVAFVVWGILIGSFLGLLVLVGVFWYLFAITPDSDAPGGNPRTQLKIVAFVFTIVAIVLGVILIWSRRKIRLVIMLLKEATKAIFDMPGLIIVPVICVIAIFILSFLFGLTTLYMASAGTLQHYRNDFYVYLTNPVMLFTMAYNFVVYLWITQFFTGIQYMIIAGAASKWYFARDKTFLGSPILTSVSNAFKFHLGTVALGALIITIVQVIKTIILSLIKNNKVRAAVQSCLEPIETFFKFLSKNAYIITAMHGQPFIRSGKRAAKLIIQNISDILAVNYIGDFILGMAKFLIVVVTLLLSIAIFAISPSMSENNIYAYVVIVIFSTVVACVSFGVFETTIDTLFICYCEDSLLNDGMARPYFMSRNLMEFVQSSKEIYGKK